MNKKVVLITGASAGIGKATAAYLASKNWIVFGSSRQSAPYNRDYKWIQMDVTSQEQIDNGVKSIIEQVGRLDVLINNAGLGMIGSLEDLPLQNIERVIQTNLVGVIGAIKAVLPHMREQKNGLIINISSVAGSTGLPYRSVYCSSKFAIEGLTESLRMELRKFNIQVCSVQPGSVATGIKNRRLSHIPADSAYQPEIGKAHALIDSHIDHGLPVEKVARTIYEICNSNRLRPKYIVAKPLERSVAIVKRWLPYPAFEKMLMRHYNMTI